MNNDSPPTSSVPPDDGNANTGSSEDATEGVTTAEGTRLSKKRLQSAREGEALDNLIRSLDIIIYCELSIIYYMEYAGNVPFLFEHLLTAAKVIPSFSLSSAHSLNSSTSRLSPPLSLHRHPTDHIFS